MHSFPYSNRLGGLHARHTLVGQDPHIWPISATVSLLLRAFFPRPHAPVPSSSLWFQHCLHSPATPFGKASSPPVVSIARLWVAEGTRAVSFVPILIRPLGFWKQA
ncbi:hypothetical protein NMG60_11002265 [Bertholletia excelsa]